jgi:hypothetical protein
MLPEPIRCSFPGCIEFGEHSHHVTYEPEVVKPLCRLHHEEITIINGQQARKYRRGLSNKWRWRNWYAWTRGELKPRRTQKALEWLAEWDNPVLPAVILEPLPEIKKKKRRSTSKPKKRNSKKKPRSRTRHKT